MPDNQNYSNSDHTLEFENPLKIEDSPDTQDESNSRTPIWKKLGDHYGNFISYLKYGNKNLLSFIAAFALVSTLIATFVLVAQDISRSENATQEAKPNEIETSLNTIIITPTITSTNKKAETNNLVLGDTGSITNPASPKKTVSATPTTIQPSIPDRLNENKNEQTTQTETTRKTKNNSSSTASSTTVTNYSVEESVSLKGPTAKVVFTGNFCAEAYAYTLVEADENSFTRNVSINKNCAKSWPINLVGLDPELSYKLYFSVVPADGNEAVSKSIIIK